MNRKKTAIYTIFLLLIFLSLIQVRSAFSGINAFKVQVKSQKSKERAGSAQTYQQHRQPEGVAQQAQDSSYFSTILRDAPIITAAADSQYLTSNIREFFLGKHYRETWATPLAVPVINFSNGNLELTGRDAGSQTETLFAQDSTGKRYAIRTLHKDLEQFIPKIFQQNFVVDVVQDQVSASYPYAKLITTTLAEAAGIYTTSSRVVYVAPSEDSSLPFKVSGGNLAIMEEFVSGELVRKKYGHPAKNETYSTEEVISRLLEESNIKIDQEFVLKVRLFDLLINDWHRHEGQFLWVEIKREGEPNILRPFPIDRDNALLLTDGLLPWIATRKWAARKFQNFSPDIRDMAGMNYVARYFDRYFLNNLTRQTWLDQAEEVKKSITDSVIHQAVSNLPEQLYQKRGAFFEQILQKRRDRLVEFADRYYKLLNNTIDIIGTQGEDVFTIEYNAEGDIRFIRQLAGEKEGTFPRIDTLVVKHEETREVRLYGMDGKDTFIFNIATKLPVDLHIVGGNNNQDVFIRDDVARAMGNVHLYPVNVPRKSDISFESRSQEMTERFINLYGYNYQEFEYNEMAPVVDFSINEDDGLFLGGGSTLTKHGFRKYPYGSKQTLRSSVAFSTGSFNINYLGEFIRAVGSADLILNLDIAAPNSRTNFFGFGNETPEINNTDFHNVRIDQIFNMALLRYPVLKFVNFEIGSTFEVYKPKREGNKFVNTTASGLDDEDFETKSFLGLVSILDFDFTNGTNLNRQGLEALFSTKFTHSLEDNEPFLTMNYLLSYFKPIEKWNTTFATRIGMGRNIGDFEFYQANTLGGQLSASPNTSLVNAGNFRGMPRHRFSGRTVFYQNTDLRIALFDFESFLIPGRLGILALADHGRVWNSDLSSSKWHVGAGGGVWYNALNRFVIGATWATSDVDQSISLNIGFMF